MAGLRARLRQMYREVGRQRGDSPMSRAGDGNEEADATWEQEREIGGMPPRPWRAETVGDPWRRDIRECPAPASAASETHGAQRPDHIPRDTNGSRESRTDAVLARVRARLGAPDALREAFVLKEILDRPLARRRAR